MRRTSPLQQEIMVDYMEKYGDLSRFCESSDKRMSILHRWTELTDILNAEKTGDAKSIEKWRKVWSDLKSNTKRKAVKCQSASVKESKNILQLNDFERRILSLANGQGPEMTEDVIEETNPEFTTIEVAIPEDTTPEVSTLEDTTLEDTTPKVTTPEVITEQPIPIMLDINLSGEENGIDVDFKTKECKTEEEEFNSLRIQKEKLLIIKEEIAVRREVELLKFEKEKHRLEIYKLKLEIELLIDNK